MTEEPMITVVGLQKWYGTGDSVVRALNGVTTEFAERQFTAIMGPSGSGKSTLLHCIAGLDPVNAGSVRVDGVELTSLGDRELTLLRRDRMGFVFQSFNLMPVLSARRNIVLPLELAGRSVDAEWFDTVTGTLGLDGRLEHSPSKLSGGEQQRVACARALVGKPSVIFADEPTGNLDSRSGAETLTFLRRFVDEFGQTVVMVTHDPAAAAYADRVLFLVDGDVVTEVTDPATDDLLDTVKKLGPA